VFHENQSGDFETAMK